MKRLTEAWFEFKGIDSRNMGIFIRQMPTRALPGRNINRKPVAGKNGTLVYGDTTYKDVNVRLECDARDESRMSDICAWLSGDGRLRFSDEPDREYQASVDKEFSRSSIQARLTGQRFTITWVCNPYRYLYPAPVPINISTSGTTISNPGTAPALPRIEITGSGDFSLSIGSQTAYFQGVTDGIIIDSELGDALTKDGTSLANNWMDGELYEIQPGANVVSWTTGGEDDEGNATTGKITAVKILPRWRYM